MSPTTREEPPVIPPRVPGSVLARALRRRCVHCGGEPVFTSWFRMVPSCPVCGLRFERGERGYWLGAYFFNLMLVETAFAVWIVGAIWRDWPAIRWQQLQWQIGVLMLLTPFLFFPFSKTLFLAFDLAVRPPTADDFRTIAEPRRVVRRERGR